MVGTRPDVDPSKRYTEASVARILGVHRHTVERWRREGAIVPLPPNMNNLRIYYKGVEVLRAWCEH